MIAILTALILLGGSAAAPSPASAPELRALWTSGEGGYHTYRIPAIVATPEGTLLAFCEGRKKGRGDTGDIDLLCKRSMDGGKSWSEQAVLWDDGPNVCGNPCPVVDRTTGTVWLLLTHNLGHDSEREIIAGTSEGSRAVWVTCSKDEGRTWTEPAEITSTTKREDWTWYATGPGIGIQLQRGPHAGRLIVPCDHIEAESKRYFSHVILSDDHGATWRLGGRTPTDQVNECQVAELADGRLLLNMRNYDRSQRQRAFSFSEDGGETWSAVAHHPQLEEPICQASLLWIPVPGREGADRLVFSNPASADSRVNMTVKLSDDGGATWPARRTIHAGPAAYSCLVALPGDSIGCLFEGGEAHPCEKIYFASFDLDWLRGAAGESAPPK